MWIFFSAERHRASIWILQTITGRGSSAAQRCSTRVSVMELCVGWELTDVGSHRNFHMKTLLQCHIMENRRSYPDDYSSGLCSRSNGLAWGALYQISFWVEALHSFLTFTVGSVQPLFEASWLSICTEAPPATLEKPSASDLHCLAPLVCSVWPVPLGGGERANYQPPLRDQYDVILLLRHNRLQMRGAGPLLCSLIHLTKSREDFVFLNQNGFEYLWILTFFFISTHLLSFNVVSNASQCVGGTTDWR